MFCRIIVLCKAACGQEYTLMKQSYICHKGNMEIHTIIPENVKQKKAQKCSFILFGHTLMKQ